MPNDDQDPTAPTGLPPLTDPVMPEEFTPPAKESPATFATNDSGTDDSKMPPGETPTFFSPNIEVKDEPESPMVSKPTIIEPPLQEKPEIEETPYVAPVKKEDLYVPKVPAPLPPATPPQIKRKSSSTIALTLLSLLALAGIAASTFLYLQNQALINQLITLQQIQKQREVLPTPTPTPTEPTATPSATPTPSPQGSLSAFSTLADILTLARQESATAQLLMITSDNIVAAKPTFKYWFRKSAGTKSYFFVQYEIGSAAKLFTSANVTPDNNIPDLIEYYDKNQLGLDIAAAEKLAWDQIVKEASGDKQPTQIDAKYLRSFSSNTAITTPINLWQLTYKIPGTSDIVVQVDAQKGEIAFTSLPKETPEAN